jgi:cell division protease FtsH
MVTKWGLSEKLGPLTYSEEEGEVFLGRSVTQHKQVSDVTVHLIDEEVRAIIDRNYSRARELLESHLDELHAMSAALIKYETINLSQIEEIMAGKEPSPPADWDDTPDSDADSDKGEPKAEGEGAGSIGGPASEH